MMVRTKQCITRQYVEEIPVEEGSSSEEEMAMAPIDGSSEESTVEDIATEEEAMHRQGRKLSEGRVSFKTIFYWLN